ncbi:MAG: hypothetical protein ACLR23_06840 [Clostridia bacterium]
MADEFSISSFECEDCPNRCNITRMQRGEQQAGCWGSRCGKYWRLDRKNGGGYNTENVHGERYS